MGTNTRAFISKLRAWTVAVSFTLAAFSATAVMAQELAPNKEVVKNPYDLNSLWAGGDFVARGTLIILGGMSVGSWFIMLTKLWDQRRLRKQYVDVAKGFWTTGSLRESLEKLKGKDHAFRAIGEDGLRAAEHHEGRLTDQIPLHEWIATSLQRSVDNFVNRIGGGLSFLATTGSTAPFIGLFGTVWGIYHALIAIGLAGQASIDKVAGPVGEALIMTAIGLFVAVPAVLGYNILLRRNKDIIEKARNFTSDVHAYLVSGSRVQQAGAAVANGRPSSPAVAVAGAAPRK